MMLYARFVEHLRDGDEDVRSTLGHVSSERQAIHHAIPKHCESQKIASIFKSGTPCWQLQGKVPLPLAGHDCIRSVNEINTMQS